MSNIRNKETKATITAIMIAEELEKVVDAVSNGAIEDWLSNMGDHIHPNDTGDVLRSIKFLAALAEYHKPNTEDDQLIDAISHRIDMGPIMADLDDDVDGVEASFLVTQKLYSYVDRNDPVSVSQQLGKDYQFLMVLALDEGEGRSDYKMVNLAYTHDLV